MYNQKNMDESVWSRAVSLHCKIFDIRPIYSDSRKNAVFLLYNHAVIISCDAAVKEFLRNHGKMIKNSGVTSAVLWVDFTRLYPRVGTTLGEKLCFIYYLDEESADCTSLNLERELSKHRRREYKKFYRDCAKGLYTYCLTAIN